MISGVSYYTTTDSSRGQITKYYPRLYILTMIHNRRVKMTTYIVYFGKRATFFATKSFKFFYLLYILAKWFWNFVQPVILLDIKHILEIYLIIRFRNCIYIFFQSINEDSIKPTAEFIIHYMIINFIYKLYRAFI